MDKQRHKEAADIDDYLVQAVIKAKEKEKTAESALIKAGSSIIGCIAVTAGYAGLKYTISGLQGTAFITGLLADPVIIGLTAVIIIATAWMQRAKFKFEKAEKEYDELKDDMIERAARLWESPEKWKNRAHVYEELKKKYNIHLFHK